MRRVTASRDHVREPASDGHCSVRIASDNLQLLMRTLVGLRFGPMAQLMERRDGPRPARSAALQQHERGHFICLQVCPIRLADRVQSGRVCGLAQRAVQGDASLDTLQQPLCPSWSVSWCTRLLRLVLEFAMSIDDSSGLHVLQWQFVSRQILLAGVLRHLPHLQHLLLTQSI